MHSSALLSEAKKIGKLSGQQSRQEWKEMERGIRGTDAGLIRVGAISVPLFHPGGSAVSSATVDPDTIGIPAVSHVPETGYREDSSGETAPSYHGSYIVVNITRRQFYSCAIGEKGNQCRRICGGYEEQQRPFQPDKRGPAETPVRPVNYAKRQMSTEPVRPYYCG